MIKRTNVVMLKLLAISRNALVVVAGIVLFSEHVSGVQFVGYAISLTFFGAYNFARARLSQQPPDCSRSAPAPRATTAPPPSRETQCECPGGLCVRCAMLSARAGAQI